MQPHLRFTGFLGKRVHLGVSGSVAAYKALDLMRRVLETGADVGATVTDAAARFVTPLSFQALGADPVYGEMFTDADRTFAHLEPAQAADAFVVAPATANTLAKLAHGIADTQLSCQALAFERPLVLAPAMNPRLWRAAPTQENWQTLQRRGHVCLTPGSGAMACGEAGDGRFPELEALYLQILRQLSPQDLAGKRFLATLGPTREYFDPVRFWSNPSSGIMGASVAVAAWLRGAEVTAVCGPVDLYLPHGITRVDVTSAADMHTACLDLWPDADIGCLTAAVADYRPASRNEHKFKKETAAEGLKVSFARNEDILLALGQAKKEPQRLIGFAAETKDLEAQARGKLQRKNLDLVVGNLVGADKAFGTADNTVFVADREGRGEHWPAQSKPDVAWRILDWLLQL